MSIVSYGEAYRVLLACYPEYCRAKIRKNNKWGMSWVENELEVGYALDQIEGVIDSPLEKLMLYTAGMVLSAGRESDFTRESSIEELKCIISEHGLEFLLESVSDSDSTAIRSDLEILGVI